MTETTFHLMDAATGRFLRQYGNPDESRTFLAVDGDGPAFATADIADIHRLMRLGEGDRTPYGLPSIDRVKDEFFPVAAVKRYGAVVQGGDSVLLSTDLVRVELENLRTPRIVRSRDFSGTPRNLLKSYIPADLLSRLDGMDPEFLVFNGDNETIAPGEFCAGGNLCRCEDRRGPPCRAVAGNLAARSETESGWTGSRAGRLRREGQLLQRQRLVGRRAPRQHRIPSVFALTQNWITMQTIILASQMTGCFPTIIATARDRALGNRLLYIPTAAYGEGWEPVPETDIVPFEDAGFVVEMFDLAGKTREETVAALDRTDVVFVGGGNTFYLVGAMKTSGFAEEIGGRVENGLVYIGSSAGSVAATPDITYAASVDDPSKGDGNDNVGLGFIDRPVLPHMDHVAFAPYVCAIADAFDAAGTEYYGLDDNEAVVIDENGARIVRASSVQPQAPTATIG
ncbi:peptidase E [Rhizobium sp. BK176]|uniref:peptidase E n=1 Tax=Rhizobium sp. BK176 TaxID=2587071 RepID=UPI0021676318|nr:peptidase E [Rhizobium sp. BK176]MCS4089909.1 peptidase E [Rhizobium sp. BK176]